MEYVFSMLLGTLLLPYIFTSHLTFKKIKCLCFESISLCVALDHSVEVFFNNYYFLLPQRLLQKQSIEFQKFCCRANICAGTQFPL